MRLLPEYRCDIVVVLLEIGVSMKVIQSFKNFFSGIYCILLLCLVLEMKDQ